MVKERGFDGEMGGVPVLPLPPEVPAGVPALARPALVVVPLEPGDAVDAAGGVMAAVVEAAGVAAAAGRARGEGLGDPGSMSPPAVGSGAADAGALVLAAAGVAAAAREVEVRVVLLAVGPVRGVRLAMDRGVGGAGGDVRWRRRRERPPQPANRPAPRNR
jgi:hypothetical protein